MCLWWQEIDAAGRVHLAVSQHCSRSLSNLPDTKIFEFRTSTRSIHMAMPLSQSNDVDRIVLDSSSDSEYSYYEGSQDTRDVDFPFRDAGVQVDMPTAPTASGCAFATGAFVFGTLTGSGADNDSTSANPEEMVMEGFGSAIFSFNDPDLEGHAVKFPREGRTHTYDCVALRMKGNNEFGVCLETKTARAGWIGCGQQTFDILRLLDNGFVVYADVTWVKKYFWYRVDSDCWDGVVRWRAYPKQDAGCPISGHEGWEFSDWEDGSMPEPNYYSGSDIDSDDEEL
ncbi:hypothetical protein BJ508DRAFT_312629 [Ascobolus immersus RN42]|uniref:Uncharacterized protein n=1 Tax=Ascobolus immersus RN42 TaxID=1160509 RepID=A0A3N4HQF3_ASCIM|nr:hypothetical protein BJ508DRAFT_312629 [Ascobolus immersus RN42]